MTRIRLGIAALVPLALGACSAPSPRPGRVAMSRPALSRPALAPPPAVAAVPPGAAAIARLYATAAFSYGYRLGPDAWITAVAGLCTPQWLTWLRASGDGGSGGWSHVVAEHDIATATIVGVLPVRSAPPALRMEVLLEVSVVGLSPRTQAGAVMVDVLALGANTWLVSWAG